MTTNAPLPFDPISEAERQWAVHGWADAAAGMAAVISFIRVERILFGRIRAALEPLGITFVRYEVLMLLFFSSSGMLPLGKIGSRTHTKPGSITNACDQLEAQGLIVRKQHPNDGRTTLAEITPAGRAVAQVATQRLNEGVFSTLGFTPDETSQVVTLLRHLRHQAGDFAESEEAAIERAHPST